MRFALTLVAIGIIVLGILVLSKSFEEPLPSSSPDSQIVSNNRQQPANPFIIGLGLVSGGVIFLVMILRRR